MTYGAEAVISLEIRFPTLRTSSFTSSNNDGLLEKSLDLRRMKKKCHGSIGVLSTQVQAGVRLNVRLRPLAPRDLVLRKVLGTTKNPVWGKLGPNWEMPYRITSVAGIDAYYLEDLDENVVSHP